MFAEAGEILARTRRNMEANKITDTPAEFAAEQKRVEEGLKEAQGGPANPAR